MQFTRSSTTHVVFPGVLLLATTILCLTPPGTAEESSPPDDPLRVALTFDIPPYIQEDGEDGLEPAILRRTLKPEEADLLPGQFPLQFEFNQMSYDDVEEAIALGEADIAMTMALPKPELLNDEYFYDGVYYSQQFIAFTNAAFVKVEDDIDNITSISQLADYGPVYTWEGAIEELGDEFEETFTNSTKYTEVAIQTFQVSLFWNTTDAVIVIDSSIFAFTSMDLFGFDENDYVAFDLFPPVTTFAVGFASKDLRDQFERGMDDLCESGEYARLLERYNMKYNASMVCDGRMDITGGNDGSSAATIYKKFGSWAIIWATATTTVLTFLLIFAL